MDAVLVRSHQLKLALNDFVLDAEDELAQALETYAALKLRRGSGDNTQQNLTIDSFTIEGKVGKSSPLDLFIQNHPDLSQSDRELISSWHRSFIGLFAITQILPDGFELRNWLTDKHYIVKPNNAETQQVLSRFKEGEILLTRISPITDTYWTFSGPYTQMGKLGKPKLAVAIGNFKENHKNHLYSDAPDLLEEAWQSVSKYHQQFVDFFGGDEITLPGYQLNKKIAELQEILSQKQLEAAGIDPSKSLEEVAQEAGIEQEDIKAAAAELGADSKVVEQLFVSLGLGFSNITFKVLLELVELKTDLLGCAALLIDRDNALLEVDARLNRSKYLIAGAENSIEEFEFFIQELIDPNVCGVGLVQKVHNHHIELLPVAMAPANALLDTLRVPRKVIVDDKIAELEVDTLGGGFRGNHNAGLFPEVID